MHTLKLGSLVLCVTIAACAANAAQAASSQAVAAGEATVRLLASGLNHTNPAPVFRGGVEIVLAPGWKTYWRYPGDAGIPPRFDWSGSENVAHVDVLYPAPKRIVDGSGQTSIGYDARVIFPLRIRAKDPTKPLQLNLKLDFATCEKLCVPAQAQVSLSFSANAQNEPLLAKAEEFVPRNEDPAKPHALAILDAKLERGKTVDGSDGRILVTVRAPRGSKPDLFAEGPDEEWTLALPELLRHEAGQAIFAISLQGARMGKPDVPPSLRLTLVAGTDSVETAIPLD